MALADDDPYVEELLGNAPGRAAAPLPARELRAELALRRAAARRGRRAGAPRARPRARCSRSSALGLIAALRRRPAGAVRGGDRLHGPDPARAHADADPGAAGAGPAARRRRPADRAPALLPAPRGPPVARGLRPAGRLLRGRAGAGHGRCSAPAHVGLDDWPVLALALAAQAVCDAGFTRRCAIWLALGTPPQMQLRLFAWVLTVDAALAPVGILAGVAGEQPAARRGARASASWACSPSSRASGARTSTRRSRCRTPTAAPRCS